VAFALAAVLGFLSQLVFVFCFAALALWSLVRVSRTGQGRLRLLGCLLPPALFAFWLYVESIRGVIVGGSDVRPLGEILTGALSLALGGPESAGPLRLVAACIALLALLAGLFHACRRYSDTDTWVFYVAVIVAGPLLLILHPERQYLHARHFLVPTIFLLILLAGLLGRLWRSGNRGKWVCAAMLLAFLAVNAAQTARLIRLGRGGYSAALRRMTAETLGDVTRIGSDHDFRNGMLFFYYRRKMPEPLALYYHTVENRPEGGPEWFVRHSTSLDFVPEPMFRDAQGNHYVLREFYPFAGLSGWHWAIYHNERNLHAPGLPGQPGFREDRRDDG
jgi:hypothetical protein